MILVLYIHSKGFMVKGTLFILFLLMSFGVTAANDPSQNVVVDGAYYNWNVYYIDDLSGDKRCYIASFAETSIGNYKKERKPYIMITHFMAKDTEEVSVFADYDYKLKSSIYIGIDNKLFRMFTKGKMAWTKDLQEDKIMIKELLLAKAVKVRGETIVGEYTVDNYSTNGLARAYSRMKELCRE